MKTFVEKLVEETGRAKLDAVDPLRINVTKEDIRLGVRGDAECCALSLACMRMDPRVEGAFFFKATAWLIYHDKVVRYALPPSTQQEITLFDRARASKPRELTLSPSVSRTRNNARRQYENGRAGGKYKPRTKKPRGGRSYDATRKLRSFG